MRTQSWRVAGAPVPANASPQAGSTPLCRAEVSSASIIPRLSGKDLFQIIDHWVAAQPDMLLFVFLDSRGEVLEQLTYRQFSDAVDRLAGHFRQTVTADRGARILLCYQPGLELICALFACNKAGFVGVPTLPLAAHQLTAWLHAVDSVLGDSQAAGIAMCGTTWKLLDACQPGLAEGREARDRLLSLRYLPAAIHLRLHN
jgi:hypothetical protein